MKSFLVSFVWLVLVIWFLCSLFLFHINSMNSDIGCILVYLLIVGYRISFSSILNNEQKLEYYLLLEMIHIIIQNRLFFLLFNRYLWSICFCSILVISLLWVYSILPYRWYKSFTILLFYLNIYFYVIEIMV